MEDADDLPGMRFGHRADYARRRIGRSVVDQHEFAGELTLVEHAQNPRGQLGNVELFVVTGRDDGELDLGSYGVGYGHGRGLVRERATLAKLVSEGCAAPGWVRAYLANL